MIEYQELQLRWDGERLLVAEKWRGDDRLMMMLEVALLGVFKYHGWKDTRWVSLGPTGRAMSASELLGITNLVDFIRGQPNESDYYIHGFRERSTKDVKKFYMIASLSCYVSDAVLLILLGDGRLPLKIVEVEEAIKEESAYIFHLPDSLYEVLSLAAGANWWEVRTDVNEAAHTAASFMLYRFRAAKEPPWSLCGPHKAARLAAFADEDRPAGVSDNADTARKIWDLQQSNYPPQEIEEGVGHLENIDWTIAPAEQAHRASSEISKNHKTLCKKVLCQRSMVSMIDALWPKVEKKHGGSEAVAASAGATAAKVLCSRWSEHVSQEPQRNCAGLAERGAELSCRHPTDYHEEPWSSLERTFLWP